VPAGHYTFPANLTDAHFKIGPGGPGPVVIAGAGASSTIIDGQGSFGRLLLVNPGAIVTVKNLTLQHGLGVAEDGGGIANLGTLTLDHVVVANNQTWSPAGALPGKTVAAAFSTPGP
jgi:hypothetical protein